jgi:hypothetical protein
MYFINIGSSLHRQVTKASRITRRKIFRLHRRVAKLLEQLGEKYFDYFVFNIIDYIRFGYGLSRSGARHRALAQTIGNARGLDINSPLSVEAHTQDLRHRHQQHSQTTRRS